MSSRCNWVGRRDIMCNGCTELTTVGVYKVLRIFRTDHINNNNNNNNNNIYCWASTLIKGKNVKIKVTVVQALRLCTGHTAHRGSRGIALLFHYYGTRSGWGVSVTPWPLFTPGKDPVPIVQEAGWAPGPVWTGAENLAPTGIRSPDRPARSQSLYPLRYPTPSTLTL